MFRNPVFRSLALAALLAASPVLADQGRSIIVMDGSGSMWGQIDGRPKLEIAREVLGTVLQTVPPGQELGLIAYGHRTRGQCDDIELMVPAAPGTAEEITARVAAMRFQGMTPLTDAVREAALALRSTETAATVILVTDGLETCDADPCALARELEATGLDFTAHVIGFGLTEEEGAQVACLAEETGGRYLQAADAGALADALTQTVAALPEATSPIEPPPPEPAPVALLAAPATAGQGTRILVSWAGPRSVYDYVRLFDATGEWRAEAAVGETNPLELQLPWLTGEFTLAYVLQSGVISEEHPITLTPEPVSITAPVVAQVGQEVTITWQGPDASLDTIQLLDATTGERWGYGYVADQESMAWTMPDVPGSYSFAYVFQDSDVIHSTPILVTLDAPAPDVPPSVLPKAVPVTFTGEGTGDLPLSITWSATPLPGQDLPPEAWAMQDGALGPVGAEFLPGRYDVTGMAGDTVFAGQVTVSAEGPNDFTIPVSASLGPAGPDAPPVLVTLSGPYMGTLRQWAAIPLPDGEVLRSTDETGAPWDVTLTPGRWLVTAIASGAGGEGLAQVVDVTGPGPVEIGQPTFATTPFTDVTPFHQRCEGAAPCVFRDEISGLRLLLLPGWLMQDPYPVTTAAGEAAALPSTLFGTEATGSTPLAALNPRQWDATLGPCEVTAAGDLCRLTDLPVEALEGLRVIAATLRVSVSSAPPRPEPVIEGTPLNLDPETAALLRNRLLGGQ